MEELYLSGQTSDVYFLLYHLSISFSKNSFPPF